jgi:5-methylcytosine-specific restriction endonuclease McrA
MVETLVNWLKSLLQPTTFGQPRSSQWPKVRSQHLEKWNWCAGCGKRLNLEVHHIIPVHVDPNKQLEPENLITLCRPTCHPLLGHLGNWSNYNPHVREDAALIFSRVKKTA